jgi:FG-GAP repeat
MPPRGLQALAACAVLQAALAAVATWPASAPASFSLSKLTGGNGALIQSSTANEYAGQSIAFGDFNGDGKADMLIGTWSEAGASPSTAASAGKAYIVYGRTTIAASPLSLAAMPAAVGVTITGPAAGAYAGFSVATADVNADGYADIVLGSPGTANGAKAAAGAVYVIYGRASLGAALTLPPAAGAGFTILGANAYDEAGTSVAGGFDFNKVTIQLSSAQIDSCSDNAAAISRALQNEASKYYIVSLFEK